MYASQSIRLPDIRPLTHAGAARLTIVVLGLVGLACGFPRRCAAQAEDLSGRVVDKAGVAVSGAKVWAIGGDWETARDGRDGDDRRPGLLRVSARLGSQPPRAFSFPQRGRPRRRRADRLGE